MMAYSTPKAGALGELAGYCVVIAAWGAAPTPRSGCVAVRAGTVYATASFVGKIKYAVFRWLAAACGYF